MYALNQNTGKIYGISLNISPESFICELIQQIQSSGYTQWANSYHEKLSENRLVSPRNEKYKPPYVQPNLVDDETIQRIGELLERYNSVSFAMQCTHDDKQRVVAMCVDIELDDSTNEKFVNIRFRLWPASSHPDWIEQIVAKHGKEKLKEMDRRRAFPTCVPDATHVLSFIEVMKEVWNKHTPLFGYFGAPDVGIELDLSYDPGMDPTLAEVRQFEFWPLRDFVYIQHRVYWANFISHKFLDARSLGWGAYDDCAKSADADLDHLNKGILIVMGKSRYEYLHWVAHHSLIEPKKRRDTDVMQEIKYRSRRVREFLGVDTKW